MSYQRRLINYTVACVNMFADTFNMSVKEAYRYLRDYKGIAFLKDFYEEEHLLSFENVVEDLQVLCRRNGGNV
ncbi:DUF3791 domain-containing protein [Pseudobutyrivibrio sp.]|uniref:DUF3791 domain-containing protein n=1 Tax=Pseudobutyrivibrio sp. TaxID=2014367 RepID=UPI001B42D785|nr:DUF3791 domain-containing protein [Pseudobutyrivibrio sp.]MBP3261022.1 DUF3791 domain-containing protein [Pseudobutyrivibrio sp.]